MKKNLPKSKSKNNLKQESIAKKVFRKKKHSKEKPIFAKSVHDNEIDKQEDVSFITESTRQNNLLNNMKLMRKIINSSETQDQVIHKEKINQLEEENQILRQKLIEMERNAQMVESQLDLQLQLQNQSMPRSTDIDNAEFLLQEEKLMNQQKEQDLLKQKIQLQEYNDKIEQENSFLKTQNLGLKNENKILLNQNFQFKEDLRNQKKKYELNLRNSQKSKKDSARKTPKNEKLIQQNLVLENQLNEIQDKYQELVKNSKNVDSQLVFFTNALNSLLNTQFKYKLVTPPVRETYKKLQNFGEQILKIQEQVSKKKLKQKISNPHQIFNHKSTYIDDIVFNKNIINQDLPKLTLDNVSQIFKSNDFVGQQNLSPTKQTPINKSKKSLNLQTLSQRVRRIEEYLEFNTDYKKKASFQNVFNEPFKQFLKII